MVGDRYLYRTSTSPCSQGRNCGKIYRDLQKIDVAALSTMSFSNEHFHGTCFRLSDDVVWSTSFSSHEFNIPIKVQGLMSGFWSRGWADRGLIGWLEKHGEEGLSDSFGQRMKDEGTRSG
jgi:hypothetical protein